MENRGEILITFLFVLMVQQHFKTMLKIWELWVPSFKLRKLKEKCLTYINIHVFLQQDNVVPNQGWC